MNAAISSHVLRACPVWIALLFAPTWSAGAAPIFPGAMYAVGVSPMDVVAGDFNADGIADAAVVNFDTEDISVLLGSRGGGFAPEMRVPADNRPRCLSVGHFNGDGIPDLVTAGWTGGTIHLGRGDGDFGNAQPFDAGISPLAMDVGDFNGDGIDDLAVAVDIHDEVSIFLGTGDGGVLQGETHSLQYRPGGITVGDFDGDDRLDLAVSNRARVSVFWGEGDGRFEPADHHVFGGYTASLTAGDFNGDGLHDLAVANDMPEEVLVLTGDGSRGFREEGRYPFTTYLSSIQVDDIDADGNRDLVVTNSSGLSGRSGSVSVLLGVGDGTFREASTFEAGFPRSAAVGDLDGDGDRDVATVSSGTTGGPSTHVLVLYGDGDGTLETRTSLPSGYELNDVVIGDFNGDDLPDIAAPSGNSHEVSVLLAEEYALFGPERRFAVGRSPESIAAADFNTDGVLDLVTANRWSNDVSVLLGRGDGSFEADLRSPAGSTPVALDVEEFNGDDAMDLILVNGRNVSILLGRADGTFQGTPPLYVGANTRAVKAGDLDGDSLADAVVSVRGGLVFLRGRGDGTFDVGYITAPGSWTSLVTPDLNQDGIPDLAVAGFGVIALLQGNGDGTFGAPRFVEVHGPEYLAVADFDLDGIQDLVASRRRTHDLSVYLGLGDGTVAEEMRFFAGAEPMALTAADLNGDEAPDLVVPNLRGATITVMLNQTSGCPVADNVPPVVVIHDPEDGFVLPATVPVHFESHDDDGFEGDVEYERILLEQCVILDGFLDGDGDGLLVDEELALDIPELCRFWEQCGFDVLVEPVLTVEATDCAGNVGFASRALTGSLMIHREICP